MKTASAHKIVDSTLESIKRRVPAYSDLADRFGPLFLAKGKVRDELVDKHIDPPAVDSARLVAGVPLLIDEDLSTWVEAMETSRDELLPEVVKVLQLEADIAGNLKEYLADTVNLVGLAQARIEGNWKHFENTSVTLGIEQTPLLVYISETVFGSRPLCYGRRHGQVPVRCQLGTGILSGLPAHPRPFPIYLPRKSPISTT